MFCSSWCFSLFASIKKKSNVPRGVDGNGNEVTVPRRCEPMYVHVSFCPDVGTIAHPLTRRNILNSMLILFLLVHKQNLMLATVNFHQLLDKNKHFRQVSDTLGILQSFQLWIKFAIKMNISVLALFQSD